ncbi:hypothetical protein [Rufibacter soli]
MPNSRILLKRNLRQRICFLLVPFFLLFCPLQVFPQTTNSTITVAAGPHYLKSPFHRFWFGSHYRKVWAQPVQVPYFSLSEFRGGVTPTRQGGSFQTKNLRLVDGQKREYVLRSIDKDPSVALPKFFRKTFVANLMRDQTSVIHPYGAFIVPVLAEAAGVYHTNPQLVYLGQDKALGEYENEFANTLMLLEERPDGNWEHLESFGKPKEVVSSRKAFEKFVADPSHQVDSKRYLTSRLFDMWLSDWSRREDQWRWGVTKKNGETLYSPIPRDRDHAFFKFDDGVLTFLVSLFKPNYQTFDKSISAGNVKGLIKSSKEMDTYLLAYLTQEDFKMAAQELQQNLNDAVIDKALAQWPASIQDLSAQEFAKLLKARRQDLPQAAEAFYQLLNQKVVLAGSNEKDRFELQFHPDGKVLVKQWAEEKGEARKLLHQKMFSPAETKSISIYGLGKADELVLSGAGPNMMDLHWYGGEGTDALIVKKDWKVTGKKLKLLDEEDGNDYAKSKNININEYRPRANEFDAEGWLLRYRLH